jgi:hypothetical protein
MSLIYEDLEQNKPSSSLKTVTILTRVFANFKNHQQNHQRGHQRRIKLYVIIPFLIIQIGLQVIAIDTEILINFCLYKNKSSAIKKFKRMKP